jgi:pimeloyl-ACP methyl ester carboxylesterase
MTDRTVTLPQGPVRVRETGEGPPVVFLHGVLVDGRLWDGVVARLAPAGVRCIQPDLPLGAHRLAMPEATPLAPRDVGALVADLLEALDLEDVTLVGNDSGGAFAQMVAADRPERVGRLVLTDCDALEVFPPRFFRPLFAAIANVPGATRLAAEALRLRVLRHGPLGFGRLAAGAYAPELTDDWIAPLREDAGVRRDLRKIARGVDHGEMLRVAERLQGFDRPVRLVWGTEDPFFTLDLARRLAAMLPDARVEEVPGARCFVPLDAPDAVAAAVRDAVGVPVVV